MGVCDVSLTISDKIPWKMFPNNSQKYGSSRTEDSIDKAPLTLSVLPRKYRVMKNKKNHGVLLSNNTVLASLNHLTICRSRDDSYLQTAAKRPQFM